MLNHFYKVFLLFVFMASSCKKSDQDTASVLHYVDPFIGTGFHGHTFPGPVMPHGMVQLSPDTRLNGWDASSGYHHSDNNIYGFSHTHLSGTGIGDMGDILLLPFTGKLSNKKPIAHFDKKDEQASVGLYQVFLKNFNVDVSLAVTMRTGMHRYIFRKAKHKRVLLDLAHTLQRTWGHDNVANTIEILDNYTIRGLKHTKGWANNHKVYFYLKFSTPFKVERLMVDDTLLPFEKKHYKGKKYLYLFEL